MNSGEIPAPKHQPSTSRAVLEGRGSHGAPAPGQLPVFTRVVAAGTVGRGKMIAAT